MCVTTEEPYEVSPIRGMVGYLLKSKFLMITIKMPMQYKLNFPSAKLHSL